MQVGPRFLIPVLVGAGLIAGCGDGGSDSSTPTTTGSTAQVPSQPSGKVTLQKIGDFDEPDYIAQPPESDDLYVVERPGRIRIVRDGKTLPEPALDIADQVSAEGEQGLLSVAFPPDFESSRLLYVYFTGTDQDQHVVEYSAADDGSVDEGSARELLRMDDFASNHNGGLLLFGHDPGSLYIGTGDGGLAGDPERNGQDVGSLLGKILRIDPRQSGSRPYTPRGVFGNAHAQPGNDQLERRDRPGARPEICNYGLRNPWRFSFDRETGALLIADVGQSAQEEIDFRPAELTCGNNFGWSAFEGTERFNSDQTAPGAVQPILAYGRDEGCSVTGGYVVRDPSLPALNGRYVYGDYCAGELRSFRPTPTKAIDDRPLGLDVPSLDSFGEDNDGHVYAVSLEGPVYRLVQ
jgi:glucose/arabinose dehydrogenase